MAKLKPFVLAPLLVGCYSYARIEPAAVSPGTEVRAQINGAAVDRVAPQLGTFDVRSLTGKVVENQRGQLTLEVPTGALPATGESVIQLHQRISLTPADIVALETRTVDRKRTAVLGVAVVAGVATLAVALSQLHSNSSGDVPGNEPPPVNRIPVLRFRF